MCTCCHARLTVVMASSAGSIPVQVSLRTVERRFPMDMGDTCSCDSPSVHGDPLDPSLGAGRVLEVIRVSRHGRGCQARDLAADHAGAPYMQL
jgi:hypothetical protein